MHNVLNYDFIDKNVSFLLHLPDFAQTTSIPEDVGVQLQNVKLYET